MLPVYWVAAMRRVYRQDWARTGFKFVWLVFNYAFLLLVAFGLTAVASFLMA